MIRRFLAHIRSWMFPVKVEHVETPAEHWLKLYETFWSGDRK